MRLSYPTGEGAVQDFDIYDDPELYDLMAPPNGQVEEFYINEAQRLGGPVLELACGTGRFAIPLAQKGFDVTGLDLNPGMLDRARVTAEAAGAPLTLVQADMRAFTIDEQFGLIFVTTNSLLHLHESSDLIDCFASIARHLTTHGAFIVEIFNPSPSWLSLPPSERKRVGVLSHPTLGKIVVEETINYDRASQINRGTWYYSTPTQPDFRVRPLHLRNIYPQELPLLLERGGLRLLRRYGGYDRGPFQSSSAHQICICEKAH